MHVSLCLRLVKQAGFLFTAEGAEVMSPGALVCFNALMIH